MNGKNITVIRKAKGITQEELSHALQINIATLSRWENGHFEPKTSMLRKLCEVLQVSESELLNGPRDGKVELIVSWDWGEMKKGEIRMNENKFKLILGEDGMIGLHGAGQITSHEAIEEFLSRVREQLEVALEAQIRRGAIPEA